MQAAVVGIGRTSHQDVHGAARGSPDLGACGLVVHRGAAARGCRSVGSATAGARAGRRCGAVRPRAPPCQQRPPAPALAPPPASSPGAPACPPCSACARPPNRSPPPSLGWVLKLLQDVRVRGGRRNLLRLGNRGLHACSWGLGQVGIPPQPCLPWQGQLAGASNMQAGRGPRHQLKRQAAATARERAAAASALTEPPPAACTHPWQGRSAPAARQRP